MASPIPIPIPDAVSIFLAKYPSDGLEGSLDYLREEFSSHKRTIVNWETRLRKEDKTQHDIEQIVDKMQSSIAALGIKMSPNEVIFNLAPRLAQDFVTSVPQPGTIMEGGKTAFQFFLRWWRRGKISYLYNGNTEARSKKVRKNY